MSAGVRRAKSSLLLCYDSWPRCHVYLAPSQRGPLDDKTRARRDMRRCPRPESQVKSSQPLDPYGTKYAYRAHGTGWDMLAWYGLAWPGMDWHGMAWQSPEELEDPLAHGSHHCCVPCGFLVPNNKFSPYHTTAISLGLLRSLGWAARQAEWAVVPVAGPSAGPLGGDVSALLPLGWEH